MKVIKEGRCFGNNSYPTEPAGENESFCPCQRTSLLWCSFFVYENTITPDGELFPVYHGTNSDEFFEFDKRTIGSANDSGWYGIYIFRLKVIT